jgi:transposase-like protein
MFLMETMEGKRWRRRRSFTPESQTKLLERCRAGVLTIGQVARDFDLTETAVRVWVIQPQTDAGESVRAQASTGIAGQRPAASGSRWSNSMTR